MMEVYTVYKQYCCQLFQIPDNFDELCLEIMDIYKLKPYKFEIHYEDDELGDSIIDNNEGYQKAWCQPTGQGIYLIIEDKLASLSIIPQKQSPGQANKNQEFPQNNGLNHPQFPVNKNQGFPQYNDLNRPQFPPNSVNIFPPAPGLYQANPQAPQQPNPLFNSPPPLPPRNPNLQQNNPARRGPDQFINMHIPPPIKNKCTCRTEKKIPNKPWRCDNCATLNYGPIDCPICDKNTRSPWELICDQCNNYYYI